MLEKFDHHLIELTGFYRANPIIDLKEVKPRLDALCRLVVADPFHRDDYLARFLRVVEEIKVATDQSDITRNSHVLDFCMRQLRWPEVGRALKSAHSNVVNADARLEVEALIKRIYDPAWQGGEFEILGLGENIWE